VNDLETMSRSTVLIYHGIGTGHGAASRREGKYWVSPETFRRHLAALAGSFCFPTLDEFWQARRACDRRPVVITFDDGQESDYGAAWPLLQEAHAAGTFFLNTATIGRAGYLTWPQVREMQRSGMSFQSHGHDHAYLTRLPGKDLKDYLLDSLKRLEDGLGAGVDLLAPPYGDLNRRLVETALECGFRAVCASRNRQARAGAPVVDRVAAYGSSSPETIAHLAAGDRAYLAARALRSVAIFLPKQVFLLWNRRTGGTA